MLMIRGGSGGTLGPLVWFFVLCVFYLLPVIFLEKYIGGWAWVAGIGFWATVYHGFKIIAKVRSKHE
jgi:hypothetical protein